jgi:hypothetical protein
MKKLLLLLAAAIPVHAYAQQDSLHVSGFVDAYYTHAFGEVETGTRGALFNHTTTGAFSINLALLQASYSSDRVRANVGVMGGTYAQQNLSSEPAELRNLYEANVGYELVPGLWLDAGVLPSHIGMESAVSADNPTLTRSLMAENSPYFETGAKLTYTSGSLSFSTLVLNGWQNIRDNNEAKSFGTQVQYNPSEELLLNSSTYIGRDNDADAHRFFHNLYAVYRMPGLWVRAAFDIGVQGGERWFGNALIIGGEVSKTVNVALRVESYSDTHGVIVAGGIMASGYSVNIDYTPRKNVYLRSEIRSLSGALSNTTSMAVKF